jgi:hypothetical protein
MSIFEYRLTLYAIVAGLGVLLLVRSVGQMIEARDRDQLYWVHTCWIALVSVAHVVSWLVLWRFSQHSSWKVLEALLLPGVPILHHLVSHRAAADWLTRQPYAATLSAPRLRGASPNQLSVAASAATSPTMTRAGERIPPVRAT